MSMDRRKFVATLPALAAGPYLGAVLTGCSSEPLTGAAEIKWDRDTCERCRMVISDRAFAAQIRDPMKKVHKFDDFGCAVFWKEHQTFSDAESEFWVVDSRAEPAGSKWLDARKAAYVGGKRSPMGYGYAGVADGTADAASFAEARKLILAKGK